MKIHFERTGGFAGRKLETTVDSDELPSAETERLAGMIERARFFDLPRSLESRAEGADLFRYVLTVEAAGRAHTIRASEVTAPEELRPLLDWLAARARGA